VIRRACVRGLHSAASLLRRAGGALLLTLTASATVAGPKPSEFSDAVHWTPADMAHLQVLRGVPALLHARGLGETLTDAAVTDGLDALARTGVLRHDVALRFVQAMNLHNRDWGHCPPEWHGHATRALLRISGLDGGGGLRHVHDVGLAPLIPLLKLSALRALSRPGTFPGERGLDLFCNLGLVGGERELGRMYPQFNRIVINIRHPFYDDPQAEARARYVLMHEFLHWSGFRGDLISSQIAVLAEHGSHVRLSFGGPLFQPGDGPGGVHMIPVQEFGSSSLALGMIGGTYGLMGDWETAERILNEASRRYLGPDLLRARMITTRPDGLDPRWILLAVLQRRGDSSAHFLLNHLKELHPNWERCPDSKISLSRVGTPCGMLELLQSVGGFDWGD
jgi:hypothetical protein